MHVYWKALPYLSQYPKMYGVYSHGNIQRKKSSYHWNFFILDEKNDFVKGSIHQKSIDDRKMAK